MKRIEINGKSYEKIPCNWDRKCDRCALHKNGCSPIARAHCMEVEEHGMNEFYVLREVDAQLQDKAVRSISEWCHDALVVFFLLITLLWFVQTILLIKLLNAL